MDTYYLNDISIVKLIFAMFFSFPNVTKSGQQGLQKSMYDFLLKKKLKIGELLFRHIGDYLLLLQQPSYIRQCVWKEQKQLSSKRNESDTNCYMINVVYKY